MVLMRSKLFELQQNNKNVRFDVSSEAAVAAHDYRIAHATRKALKYTSELHKTLAVRSGVPWSDNAGAATANSVTSSGVSSSPSRSSPRCLSSSEEEEMLSERRGRARSPKKYPAPPPPPPPPKTASQEKGENASTSNLLPKNVNVKGID